MSSHTKLTLAHDDIHVWIVDQSRPIEPPQRRAYRLLLSEQEILRCERFKFEKLQDQFLLTRAMVRTVLSQYRDRAPQNWAFETNAHGRPAISPPSNDLSFNISHSGKWIACAVTAGRSIGIDVEHRNRRNRILGIADRFFAAEECAALNKLPNAYRRHRFFVYWTLKEAYIKARGLGLALPLGQFSFECDVGSAIRIRFTEEIDDDSSRWQFYLHELDHEHQMALCVGQCVSESKLTIKQMTP